uniref:Uncharacterized protein n=1 Tax=Janibacter limosus TaxID=53458 RepID=A0AC61U338_9MICO|nr:hypothetical protein [Janibacter limosus]
MRRRRALSIVTTLAAVAAGVGLGAPGASAASAAAPKPHYVQLGDSYSAGNGAGSYTEKSCWRSPNNYGQRVATRQGATYTNAACSGGVLDDILQPRTLGSSSLRTGTYRVPVGAVDARAQWLKQAKADKLCGTPTQRDFLLHLLDPLERFGRQALHGDGALPAHGPAADQLGDDVHGRRLRHHRRQRSRLHDHRHPVPGAALGQWLQKGHRLGKLQARRHEEADQGHAQGRA